MAVMTNNGPEPLFEPMATLEIDARLMKSEWMICDRVAEYLSCIAGQSHSDSSRYSNFLSVTVNEIVELAYKTATEVGTVKFELHKNVGSVRMRVGFPCTEDVCVAICETVRCGLDVVEAFRPRGELDRNVLRLIGVADFCRVNLHADALASDGILVTAIFPWSEELQ